MTTCLSTKSPLCISIGITLELYLLDTLCLMANSRMQETSFASSIKLVMHFSLASFTSWLNWERRYEDVLISTYNISSILYTMVNWVSLVVDWGVLWYNHNISWSNSIHDPLVSSNFFLIPIKSTLFVDFAYPLTCDEQQSWTLFVLPTRNKSQWLWCWQILFCCWKRWCLTAQTRTWFSISRNGKLFLM